jgi:heme/copper-type cytochrome/quinol oxidase subunit 2
MLHRLSVRFSIPLLLVMAAGLMARTAVADAPEQGDKENPDRVINIVAERFVFVPSRIKLKQGEVVELRIRSLDTNHGFSIRGAGVNVIVPKRGKGDARILFRALERWRSSLDL